MILSKSARLGALQWVWGPQGPGFQKPSAFWKVSRGCGVNVARGGWTPSSIRNSIVELLSMRPEPDVNLDGVRALTQRV